MGIPTEKAVFSRPAIRMVDGRRTVGEPVKLGSMDVLAAPDHAESETGVGRRTAGVAWDLYLRGRPPFEVKVGDTALIHGISCTVTRTPEDWVRGARHIGTRYRVERKDDQ